MIIPSSLTFIIALAAAYLVPAWGLAPSFFPYVFLIALILVWGIERHAIELAVLYALMFELFLGGHLGVLPLAYLAVVLTYGFLRRVIALKPLAQERWGFWEIAANMAIGTLLWILMMAVSWAVLELVYRIQYPFMALVASMRDIRLVVSMAVELGATVCILYILYEYFSRKRI